MQDLHSGGTVCSPTRATVLTGRNHFRDCVDYVFGCSDMTECVPDFEFAPSRTFTVGDAVDIEKHSGEAVYVESNTQHGFRTEDDPLVVFYAWQAGDMRELSRFQHIGPTK